MSDRNEKQTHFEAKDVRDIIEEGKFIRTIKYKPVFAATVVFICGLLIVIFVRQLAATILGLFFVAIAAFVQIGIQDHKVADVYDDAVIVYADESGEKAARFEYDEIVEWTILSNNTASNAIMLKFADGRVIYKNTYQMGAAYKALMKVMAEKESRQIEMERRKNQKLVFNNPFKNWFKKK